MKGVAPTLHILARNQDFPEANPRIDRFRVDLKGLLEGPLSLLPGRGESHSVVQGPPSHDEITRIGIDRPCLLASANRCLYEFKIQSPGKTAGDFVLSLSQVNAISVEPICPKLRAAFAIDQLHVNPDLVINPPHAAFEDITDAELAADPFHVDGLALVRKGGIASDHKATGNPRQIGRQILSDPVREILLL